MFTILHYNLGFTKKSGGGGVIWHCHNRCPATTYTGTAVLLVAATALMLAVGGPLRVATAQTILPKVTLTLTNSLGQGGNITEDGGVMTVTGTMDKAAQGTVTVTISAAPANYNAPLEFARPEDFSLSENKVLTFSQGSVMSTGTVTVSAVDNDADEISIKRIRVTGTVTGNAVMTNGEKSSWWEFLIRDDDPQPFPTVVLTPSTISEDGGVSTVTVTVSNPTLRGDLDLEVKVSPKPLKRFFPLQGPFENQVDPREVTLSATTRLVIPTGKTKSTGTVTITAMDNSVDNPTQYLPVHARNLNQSTVPWSVTRFDPPGGDLRLHTETGDASHWFLLTIEDDDRPEVSFSSASSSASESVDDTHNVMIGLAPAPHSDIELAYTVDDTSEAESDKDYTIAGLGTVSVSSGDTTAIIPVEIIDDSVVEGSETVVLTLINNGSGYAVESPSVHTLTITDNDTSTEPPGIDSVPRQVRILDASATEGEAVSFRVLVEPATGPAATLFWAVTDGTAIAGKDYVSDSRGTVTIPAGAGAATFQVMTINDRIDEDDETFTVTLSGPPIINFDSGGGTATGIIRDDDTAGIGLSASALRLGDACGVVRYMVWLLSEPEASVTMDVASVAPSTVSASPQTLIFTGSDWNIPRTVTVAASDTGTTDILHRAASADGKYAGKSATLGVQVDGTPAKVAAPWLARFSRTVAEGVLDGIANRMTETHIPGLKVRVKGQAIEPVPMPDVAGAKNMAGMDGPERLVEIDGGADIIGTVSRTAANRKVLADTAFVLNGENSTDASWAFWGKGAWSHFDGRQGAVSLDGEIASGMVGLDRKQGRWLTGLALSRSLGEGGYRGGCSGSGALEGVLTMASPWVAWKMTDSVKVWGTLGYGKGSLLLKPHGLRRLETDIETTMAAAGARGNLIELPPKGGFNLAVKTDALWLRSTSDKAGGNSGIGGTTSYISRLRLGLEGLWRYVIENGRALEMRMEAGLRNDGGDAETGFGMEAGGGVSWTDPVHGLGFSIEGRGLAFHGASGFQDVGASVSLVWAPDSASHRGPSISLRQDWDGAFSGGLNHLFSPDAPWDGNTGNDMDGRFMVEAAYGFPAWGGRFTGTPYLLYGLSNAARDYGLGWRLTSAESGSNLSLGVKATRRESDRLEPEHGIGFETIAKW